MDKILATHRRQLGDFEVLKGTAQSVLPTAG